MAARRRESELPQGRRDFPDDPGWIGRSKVVEPKAGFQVWDGCAPAPRKVRFPSFRRPERRFCSCRVTFRFAKEVLGLRAFDQSLQVRAVLVKNQRGGKERSQSDHERWR